MPATMIDFLTHFHSRTFFEAVAVASPLAGDPREKLERVASGAGIELPPPETGVHVERLIEQLERANIAHAVTTADSVEEIPVLAEAAALAENRLLPFTVFDPRGGGAADRARTLFAERGFRGLVLLPAQHHFRMDDPELLEVLEAVDEFRPCLCVGTGLLRRPVHDLFHIPRSYRLDLGNPLHLVPTADRFRRSRFVLLHLGGGMLRETLLAGTVCENLYVETSSVRSWLFTQSSPLALPDAFERVLGVFGHERVLFGSDSGGVPPGWAREEYVAQREALGACGLTHDERDAVFGGNAARLLGLMSVDD